MLVTSLLILTALLLVAAIGATSESAHAEPPSTISLPSVTLQDDDIARILAQRLAEKRLKGAAVAIVEADGSARFIHAGDSGHTASPAITADTLFEIGSITKGFAGVLLAQMVARGEVSLNDTVRMHAPADVTFPPNSVGDITLQQLATHTSGLPRVPISVAFFKAMFSDPTNPYARYSRADFWTYLTARKHDATKQYENAYSNLGVGLLGELLANRAKLSFAELVRRDITVPLAMNDTHIDIATADRPRFAIGHDQKLTPTAYWDLPAMQAAGALRSSARDMATFITALAKGSLPGAKAAITPLANITERTKIGLCWMIQTARGDEIVWHNGGTGGFRSFAGVSLKSGRAVVVLTNSSISADDIGMHLINTNFPLEAAKTGMATITGSALVGASITALVWLFSVLMPFRVRFGHATSDLPDATTKSKLKQYFKPRTIHSRHDALWLTLELVAIAALLLMFGPWAMLSTAFGGLDIAAKSLMLTALAAAALLVLWRARALPWRDTSAPLSAASAFSRIFTTLLLIGVFTLWLK
jgi:serine-type D-Ala-D-Ala carboxypeptidase/endopeptidase